MVTLYSTGCPKCTLLKKSLDNSGIAHTVCTDVDKMLELGMTSVPYLDVDGELLDYPKAIEWIKEA